MPCPSLMRQEGLQGVVVSALCCLRPINWRVDDALHQCSNDTTNPTEPINGLGEPVSTEGLSVLSPRQQGDMGSTGRKK